MIVYFDYICCIMMTSRIFHSIHLDLTNNRSQTILYVLLTRQLEEKEREVVDQAAEKMGINVVLISDFKLDSETKLKKSGTVNFTKLFDGKATTFLQDLESDLFFNIENSMCVNKARRNLLGVSEFGLFAIWSTTQKKLFDNVGSICAPLDVEGLSEWLSEQPDLLCDSYYISLGLDDKGLSLKKAKNDDLRTASASVAETIATFGKKIVSDMDEKSSGITGEIETFMNQILSADEEE